MQLGTDKMLAHVTGGVGWVTFNNPARHNAVSLEMWQALGDIVAAFDADDTVRVAVLMGAGDRAFVAGADISEFDQQRANSAQRREYGVVAAHGQRALARFSKPMIAMIRGYCIGGGLAIAAAADVRFATPGSKFGIPAAKLGLGYEYAGVAMLARLVGPSVAADMLFSARQLDASEALAAGMLNFVVPDAELQEQVGAYAALVAANAPLTLRAAKAALQVYARHSALPEAESIEALVNACFDSADYREGRRAFQEKRTPQFTGK